MYTYIYMLSTHLNFRQLIPAVDCGTSWLSLNGYTMYLSIWKHLATKIRFLTERFIGPEIAARFNRLKLALIRIIGESIHLQPTKHLPPVPAPVSW